MQSAEEVQGKEATRQSQQAPSNNRADAFEAVEGSVETSMAGGSGSSVAVRYGIRLRRKNVARGCIDAMVQARERVLHP